MRKFCCFMIAISICCLFQPDAAGQSNFEGVLEKVKTGTDDETPRFVLVDGETRYRLIFPDKFKHMQGAAGRIVRINGKVSTTGEGEEKVETIRVLGFAVTARLTPEQKIVMADRMAKQKKRFEDTQVPLSEEERQAALTEFGMDSPILDGELQLRHTFKLTRHGVGCTYWEFQPDGAFEKYKLMRSADRGGETRKYSMGKGQLSTRQLIQIARLIDSQKLLELPEKIEDGTEIEADSGSCRGGAYSVVFGDFHCVGGQPRADSKQPQDIQNQQRRLSGLASRLTRTGTNNLDFQDPEARRRTGRDR